LLGTMVLMYMVDLDHVLRVILGRMMELRSAAFIPIYFNIQAHLKDVNELNGRRLACVDDFPSCLNSTPCSAKETPFHFDFACRLNESHYESEYYSHNTTEPNAMDTC
jgi:hypothetical protein